MNKNRFRLIFNEARGHWVCVAETVKSHRKDGRSQRPGKLLALSLFAAGGMPGSALAELVVDSSAPQNQRPALNQSANGTDVVNIVAPNAQGISHNQFSKFDVATPGVILNNSNVDAVSKIGGQVLRNPLLHGQEARAALIEVNGGISSRIQGAIEGLGRTMDVFIANPDGITVNGLVTVNLNRLTLTTGVPQYLANGNLGFSVHGGQINIQGSGVNTGGLSYFDLVARSVLLNATISSPDELPASISVISGLNDYDSELRSYTKRNNAADKAPLLAIDGSALGAMYGGHISFISTESGIGVRHAGLVLSEDDINITADGKIELTNHIQSGKNLSIAGRDIDIGDKARMQSLNMTLAAKGGLSNLGLLMSDEKLDITSALFSNQGRVVGWNGLNLHAFDLDNNAGLLYSGADLDLDAKGQYSNRNGAVVDVKHNLKIKAAAFENSELSTLLTREGLMELDVAGDASNAGRLLASKTLKLKAGGNVLNNKTSQGKEAEDEALIYGATGVQLDVGGDIDNLNGGLLRSGANLDLHAKGQYSNLNGAVVDVKQDLKIKAAALANGERSTLLAREGLMQLDVAGDASNAGRLLASKTLKLKAGGNVLNNKTSQGKDAEDEALISGATGVQLDAGGDIDNLNGGLLRSGANLDLHAEGQYSNLNGAVVDVQQDLKIKAAALANGERSILLARDGLMQLDVARDANNAGRLIASKTLKLKAGGNVQNKITSQGKKAEDEALIYGATGVQLDAGGDIDNLDGGLLRSGANLDLHAEGKYSNRNGAVVDAQQDLKIKAADFDNGELSTLLAREGLMELDLVGDANNAGRLIASKTLKLKAGGNVLNKKTSLGKKAEDDALIYGATGVQLDVGGDIDNLDGGLLRSGANLDIDAKGQYSNRNGAVVDVKQDLKIKVADFDNGERSTLLAREGLMQFDVAGDASNAGGLLASKTLKLKAGGNVLNKKTSLGKKAEDEALIYGATGLQLDAGGDIDNLDGGLLRSGANLDLQAKGQYSNRNGAAVDVMQDLKIKAAAFDNGERSTLLAREGLMQLDVAGDASNAGGLLASKTLKLKAGGNLLNKKTSPGKKAEDEALIYGATGVQLDVDGDTHNAAAASILAATGGNVAINTSNLINSAKALISGDSLTIKAKTLSNQESSIRAQGSKDGLLDITLSGALSNTEGGQLISAKDLDLKAQSLSNSGKDSAISAGGKIKANIDGAVVNENQALLIALDAELAAQSLDNNAGTIQAGYSDLPGSLTFTLSEGLSNRNHGFIMATGQAKITAKTLSNQEKSVIRVQASKDGLLDITLSGALSNTSGGQLISAKDLDVKADSLSNSGEDSAISAGGKIKANIDGAVVNENQALLAALDAELVAQSLDNNAGKIQAGYSDQPGRLTFTLSEGLSNRNHGFITATGQAKIRAKTLSNQEESAIRAQASNDGLLDITLSGALSNTGGGQLVSAKDLDLKAQSLSNSGEGSAISAGGKIKANIDGAVVNENQALLIALDAELAAQSLENNAGTIQAGYSTLPGRLTFTLNQGLSNRNHGFILATGQATVKASSFANASQANFLAGNANLDITEEVINDGANIEVFGQLSLKSKQLQNRAQEYEIDPKDRSTEPNAATKKLVGKLAAGLADLELSGRLDNAAIIDGDYLNLKVSALNNSKDGQIRSGKYVDITTRDYQNAGTIGSQEWAKLTLTHEQDVTINDAAKLPLALLGLSLNTNNNVIVDSPYTTPGSFEINAKGDITNNMALISAKDLVLKAGGSVINKSGALLFANRGAYISASDKFENQSGAELLALQDIMIDAGHIIQKPAAHIIAGADLYMYANSITNSASTTGSIIKANDTSTEELAQTVIHERSDRQDRYWLVMDGLITLKSGLELNDQAVIRAGGNAYIDVFGKVTVTINGETKDINKPGTYEIGGQNVTLGHRARPSTAPLIEDFPDNSYIVGGHLLDLTALSKDGPKSVMVAGQNMTVLDAKTVVLGSRAYSFGGKFKEVELSDKQTLAIISTDKFAVIGVGNALPENSTYPVMISLGKGVEDKSLQDSSDVSIRYTAAGRGTLSRTVTKAIEGGGASIGTELLEFNGPGMYQFAGNTYIILANGTVQVNPTIYSWDGKAQHYQLGGTEVTFSDQGKLLIGGQRLESQRHSIRMGEGGQTQVSNSKAKRYSVGGQSYTLRGSTLIVGGRELKVAAKEGAANTTPAAANIVYDGAGTLRNDGGLIEVGGNLAMSGNFENVAPKLTYKLSDFLQQSGRVKVEFNGETLGAHFNLAGSDTTLSYNSLFEFIDTMLDSDSSTHVGLHYYWNRDYAFRAFQELMSKQGQPQLNGGLADAVSSATGSDGARLVNQVLNTIFGSTWRGENRADLVQRWRNFKSSDNQDPMTLAFFADKKSEVAVGGTFYQTDGHFLNGTEDGVPAQRQVNVTIGDKKVNIIVGMPDAIVNAAKIKQGQGALEALLGMNKHLVGKKEGSREGLTVPAYQKVSVNLPTASELMGLPEQDSTKLPEQDSTKLPEKTEQLNKEKADPLFKSSSELLETLRNRKKDPSSAYVAPKTRPIYETRQEFINQSEYYGSDYFFKQVGYSSTGTIPVLADNFLTTLSLLNTVSNAVGGLFASRDGWSGKELVKHLMDNAQAEGMKQGLTIGKALTSEQIGKLDKDIVWYVIEEVDGMQAMVPKIYFSQATLNLYQSGPEIQRNLQTAKDGTLVNAAGQGAPLNAARALVASHGATIIDASNVRNQDGQISGNAGVLIQSRDDVINAATVGMNGGIWSKEGNVSIAADDQLLNRGATIQGDSVMLKAWELKTELGVGYDINNKQIVRNDAMLSATGKEEGSGVYITTTGDIDMQAVRIRAPNVVVNAGGKLNISNVLLGDSDASSLNMYKTGGSLRETHTETSAGSTGAIIQAMTVGDSSEGNANLPAPASTLSPPATETPSSTPGLVNPPAETKKPSTRQGGLLSLTSQGDLTLTDGSYSGDQGVFNSLGGNVKTVAGENYSYEKDTRVVEEFSVGGSVGFAGYGAGASYGVISGGETNTKEGGKVTNSRKGAAPSKGAASNGKGELASGQFGYSRSESEDIVQSLSYQNGQFNFSTGVTILALNGEVDIGGMDIYTSDTGFINVKAESVTSTKYKDELKTYSKKSDLFIGVKAEAHSSLANLADLGAKVINDRKDGKKIDPGMTAAATAGVVTDLIMGDTIGASVSFGASYSESEGTSTTTTENINTLRSGNISIQSTKGDINLTGVDIEAKNNLDIDAAGSFNLKAAETQIESNSTSFSVDASVSHSVGHNAVLQQTYSSDNLNLAGSYSESKSSETKYTNSTLKGANVNVKSGKDTNVLGSNISGDNINMDVGGNLNVKSLQDKKTSSSWSVNAGGNVGAAGGVIGDAAPYVAPSASLTVGGGKSWDNSAVVGTRAGIMATKSLDGKVAGDTNLVGATLGSVTKQGTFKTEGSTTASALEDSRDKDGFNVGGTFGFSKSGLPSATLTASRDEQVKQETTQQSGILLNDYQSAKGIQGTVKNNKSELSQVNKNEITASTDVMITISDTRTGKSAAKDNGAPATVKPGSKPGVSADTPNLPKFKDRGANDDAPGNSPAGRLPQAYEGGTGAKNIAPDHVGNTVLPDIKSPNGLSPSNAETPQLKAIDAAPLNLPEVPTSPAVANLGNTPKPGAEGKVNSIESLLKPELTNKVAQLENQIPLGASLEAPTLKPTLLPIDKNEGGGGRIENHNGVDTVVKDNALYNSKADLNTATGRRPSDPLPPIPEQLVQPKQQAIVGSKAPEADAPGGSRIENHNGVDTVVKDNALYNSKADLNTATGRRPSDPLPPIPEQLVQPKQQAIVGLKAPEADVPGGSRIENHNGVDTLVNDNPLYYSKADLNTATGRRPSDPLPPIPEQLVQPKQQDILGSKAPEADAPGVLEKPILDPEYVTAKPLLEPIYTELPDTPAPSDALGPNGLQGKVNGKSSKSSEKDKPGNVDGDESDYASPWEYGADNLLQQAKNVFEQAQPKPSDTKAPDGIGENLVKPRLEPESGKRTDVDEPIYTELPDAPAPSDALAPNGLQGKVNGKSSKLSEKDKAGNVDGDESDYASPWEYGADNLLQQAKNVFEQAQPKPTDTKAPDGVGDNLVKPRLEPESGKRTDVDEPIYAELPQPEAPLDLPGGLQEISADTDIAPQLPPRNNTPEAVPPLPQRSLTADEIGSLANSQTITPTSAQPNIEQTPEVKPANFWNRLFNRNLKTAQDIKSPSDTMNVDADDSKPRGWKNALNIFKDKSKSNNQKAALAEDALNIKPKPEVETQLPLDDLIIDSFGLAAEQYLPGQLNLSDAETMSVGLYTNGFFKPMNKGLRADKPLTDGLQHIDQGLQTALPKLSTDVLIKTYRGGQLSEGQSGIEGSTIKDAGYLSTSKDLKTARSYADTKDSKEFIIFGKSGADVSLVSIEGNESEILYPAKTAFTATLVSPNGKKIVMEESNMPASSGRKYEQDLAGGPATTPLPQDLLMPKTAKVKAKEAEDIPTSTGPSNAKSGLDGKLELAPKSSAIKPEAEGKVNSIESLPQPELTNKVSQLETQIPLGAGLETPTILPTGKNKSAGKRLFNAPQKLDDGRVGYPLSPVTPVRGEDIGTRGIPSSRMSNGQPDRQWKSTPQGVQNRMAKALPGKAETEGPRNYSGSDTDSLLDGSVDFSMPATTPTAPNTTGRKPSDPLPPIPLGVKAAGADVPGGSRIENHNGIDTEVKDNDLYYSNRDLKAPGVLEKPVLDPEYATAKPLPEPIYSELPHPPAPSDAPGPSGLQTKADGKSAKKDQPGVDGDESDYASPWEYGTDDVLKQAKNIFEQQAKPGDTKAPDGVDEHLVKQRLESESGKRSDDLDEPIYAELPDNLAPLDGSKSDRAEGSRIENHNGIDTLVNDNDLYYSNRDVSSPTGRRPSDPLPPIPEPLDQPKQQAIVDLKAPEADVSGSSRIENHNGIDTLVKDNDLYYSNRDVNSPTGRRPSDPLPPIPEPLVQPKQQAIVDLKAPEADVSGSGRIENHNGIDTLVKDNALYYSNRDLKTPGVLEKPVLDPEYATAKPLLEPIYSDLPHPPAPSDAPGPSGLQTKADGKSAKKDQPDVDGDESDYASPWEYGVDDVLKQAQNVVEQQAKPGETKTPDGVGDSLVKPGLEPENIKQPQVDEPIYAELPDNLAPLDGSKSDRAEGSRIENHNGIDTLVNDNLLYSSKADLNTPIGRRPSDPLPPIPEPLGQPKQRAIVGLKAPEADAPAPSDALGPKGLQTKADGKSSKKDQPEVAGDESDYASPWEYGADDVLKQAQNVVEQQAKPGETKTPDGVGDSLVKPGLEPENIKQPEVDEPIYAELPDNLAPLDGSNSDRAEGSRIENHNGIDTLVNDNLLYSSKADLETPTGRRPTDPLPPIPEPLGQPKQQESAGLKAPEADVPGGKRIENHNGIDTLVNDNGLYYSNRDLNAPAPSDAPGPSGLQTKADGKSAKKDQPGVDGDESDYASPWEYGTDAVLKQAQNVVEQQAKPGETKAPDGVDEHLVKPGLEPENIKQPKVDEPIYAELPDKLAPLNGSKSDEAGRSRIEKQNGVDAAPKAEQPSDTPNTSSKNDVDAMKSLRSGFDDNVMWQDINKTPEQQAAFAGYLKSIHASENIDAARVIDQLQNEGKPPTLAELNKFYHDFVSDQSDQQINVSGNSHSMLKKGLENNDLTGALQGLRSIQQELLGNLKGSYDNFTKIPPSNPPQASDTGPSVTGPVVTGKTPGFWKRIFGRGADKNASAGNSGKRLFNPPQKLEDGRVGYPASPIKPVRGEDIGSKSSPSSNLPAWNSRDAGKMIPNQEKVKKEVAKDFIADNHIQAITDASIKDKFAATFRAAGAATLDALSKGAGAKGHDVLEKTIKSSSMMKAYPEDGQEMLNKVKAAGIEGYVGHWDPNTGKLIGIYMTKNSEKGEREIYPIDLNNLEASLQGLKQRENWNTLPLTGDYDMHDIIVFSGAGRPRTPLVESKDEIGVKNRINTEVASVDPNRPLFDLEHNVVRHGPQVNFPSYMVSHEAAEVSKSGGFLGAVAKAGEFPLAAVDRGTWFIIHDVTELNNFYKSIGAVMKENWNPNSSHTYVDVPQKPGFVKFHRSISTPEANALPSKRKGSTQSNPDNTKPQQMQRSISDPGPQSKNTAVPKAKGRETDPINKTNPARNRLFKAPQRLADGRFGYPASPIKPVRGEDIGSRRAVEADAGRSEVGSFNDPGVGWFQEALDAIGVTEAVSPLAVDDQPPQLAPLHGSGQQRSTKTLDVSAPPDDASSGRIIDAAENPYSPYSQNEFHEMWDDRLLNTTPIIKSLSEREQLRADGRERFRAESQSEQSEASAVVAKKTPDAKSKDFIADAVKRVVELQGAKKEWEAIKSVAKEVNVEPKNLALWLRNAKKNQLLDEKINEEKTFTDEESDGLTGDQLPVDFRLPEPDAEMISNRPDVDDPSQQNQLLDKAINEQKTFTDEEINSLTGDQSLVDFWLLEPDAEMISNRPDVDDTSQQHQLLDKAINEQKTFTDEEINSLTGDQSLVDFQLPEPDVEMVSNRPDVDDLSQQHQLLDKAINGERTYTDEEINSLTGDQLLVGFRLPEPDAEMISNSLNVDDSSQQQPLISTLVYDIQVKNLYTFSIVNTNPPIEPSGPKVETQAEKQAIKRRKFDGSSIASTLSSTPPKLVSIDIMKKWVDLPIGGKNKKNLEDFISTNNLNLRSAKHYLTPQGLTDAGWNLIAKMLPEYSRQLKAEEETKRLAKEGQISARKPLLNMLRAKIKTRQDSQTTEVIDVDAAEVINVDEGPGNPGKPLFNPPQKLADGRVGYPLSPLKPVRGDEIGSLGNPSASTPAQNAGAAPVSPAGNPSAEQARAQRNPTDPLPSIPGQLPESGQQAGTSKQASGSATRRALPPIPEPLAEPEPQPGTSKQGPALDVPGAGKAAGARTPRNPTDPLPPVPGQLPESGQQAGTSTQASGSTPRRALPPIPEPLAEPEPQPGTSKQGPALDVPGAGKAAGARTPRNRKDPLPPVPGQLTAPGQQAGTSTQASGSAPRRALPAIPEPLAEPEPQPGTSTQGPALDVPGAGKAAGARAPRNPKDPLPPVPGQLTEPEQQSGTSTQGPALDASGADNAAGASAGAAAPQAGGSVSTTPGGSSGGAQSNVLAHGPSSSTLPTPQVPLIKQWTQQYNANSAALVPGNWHPNLAQGGRLQNKRDVPTLDLSKSRMVGKDSILPAVTDEIATKETEQKVLTFNAFDRAKKMGVYNQFIDESAQPDGVIVHSGRIVGLLEGTDVTGLVSKTPPQLMSEKAPSPPPRLATEVLVDILASVQYGTTPDEQQLRASIKDILISGAVNDDKLKQLIKDYKGKNIPLSTTERLLKAEKDVQHKKYPTQQADNFWARRFEAKIGKQLLANVTPEQHQVVRDLGAEFMSKLKPVVEEAKKIQPDAEVVFVDYVISLVNRRPWMEKSPTFAEFMRNRTLDNLAKVLESGNNEFDMMAANYFITVLPHAVATKLGMVHQNFVRDMRSISENSFMKNIVMEVREKDNKVLSTIPKLKSQSGQAKPQPVSLEAKTPQTMNYGAILGHQAPALMEGGGGRRAPSMAQKFPRWKAMAKPANLKKYDQTVFKDEQVSGLGASGTTAVGLKLMGWFKGQTGRDIDRNLQVLNLLTFVVFDGGHSFRDVLATVKSYDQFQYLVTPEMDEASWHGLRRQLENDHSGIQDVINLVPTSSAKIDAMVDKALEEIAQEKNDFDQKGHW